MSPRKREPIGRPFKVINRSRSVKKGIIASNFSDMLTKAKQKFGYPDQSDVQLVLEEDGTEIDDDDYFQSLEENTLLMLLHKGDKWTPFGVGSSGHDEVDDAVRGSGRLSHILLKLEEEPGVIALLPEADLELLAEMDVDAIRHEFSRFPIEFLRQLQGAADKHLQEKGQIRDTLGLLRIYHQGQTRQGSSSDFGSKNESKRRKK